MNGELIHVWGATWEEIWGPLSESENCPNDIFCELYRELITIFIKKPTIENLADIIDNPDQARFEFQFSGAKLFLGERSLVRFFENAYDVIDDFGVDELTSKYIELLGDFLGKFSIRYNLQNPCKLCPSMAGIFSNLFLNLQNQTYQDAHLNEIMRDFEASIRDIREDKSAGRIKTCIQKQINLIEALGRKCPGVKETTLGKICDQVNTWPHEKLKFAIKNLYAFACDYPGIRHGGTPESALRQVDMRDLIAMSILLTGFTPYLSSTLDAEIIYHGS
jgi:hypothetical protein